MMTGMYCVGGKAGGGGLVLYNTYWQTGRSKMTK